MTLNVVITAGASRDKSGNYSVHLQQSAKQLIFYWYPDIAFFLSPEKRRLVANKSAPKNVPLIVDCQY